MSTVTSVLWYGVNGHRPLDVPWRQPMRPKPLSARTARKLGDILAKALRRELEPLDRGQIGEDRSAKVFCGHPELDRQHHGLDAVGAFGRENLRAQQTVGILVGDQL